MSSSSAAASSAASAASSTPAATAASSSSLATASPAGLSIPSLPQNSDRAMRDAKNPRVFLDMDIGGNPAGRIVMELFKKDGQTMHCTAQRAMTVSERL